MNNEQLILKALATLLQQTTGRTCQCSSKHTCRNCSLYKQLEKAAKGDDEDV
jgi:hypothetical protein